MRDPEVREDSHLTPSSLQTAPPRPPQTRRGPSSPSSVCPELAPSPRSTGSLEMGSLSEPPTLRCESHGGLTSVCQFPWEGQGCLEQALHKSLKTCWVGVRPGRHPLETAAPGRLRLFCTPKGASEANTLPLLSSGHLLLSPHPCRLPQQHLPAVPRKHPDGSPSSTRGNPQAGSQGHSPG